MNYARDVTKFPSFYNLRGRGLQLVWFGGGTIFGLQDNHLPYILTIILNTLNSKYVGYLMIRQLAELICCDEEWY